ncbi:MAG: xanthine dehydrogenase family protein subunit M [Gammaproteobacteria bacterium]|nr:xanthine dehydrogenase family protein subunit M [Gammaproteobacteria bacterium]
MKPAPFAYAAPASLEEALELLVQYGEDAKIIAGGQTLGPLLNMRLVTPAILVDLNRVAELAYLRRDGGALAVGALTRQSALEDDVALATQQPLVAAAIPFVAHRAIRNRGTVGGSLAHADPAAEWGGLVAALEVELVIQRAGSAPRTLAAADFFQGVLTTALEPEELLVEIRIPPWPEDAGWSFRELARRHGDFALAGVALRLSVDAQGRCRCARVAILGVGDGPVRATEAEGMLDGQAVGEETFRAAAECASKEVEPQSDVHASAAFRRHLTRVLVEDALAEAAARARGGDAHVGT